MYNFAIKSHGRDPRPHSDSRCRQTIAGYPSVSFYCLSVVYVTERLYIWYGFFAIYSCFVSLRELMAPGGFEKKFFKTMITHTREGAIGKCGVLGFGPRSERTSGSRETWRLQPSFDTQQSSRAAWTRTHRERMTVIRKDRWQPGETGFLHSPSRSLTTGPLRGYDLGVFLSQFPSEPLLEFYLKMSEVRLLVNIASEYKDKVLTWEQGSPDEQPVLVTESMAVVHQVPSLVIRAPEEIHGERIDNTVADPAGNEQPVNLLVLVCSDL